MSYLVQTNIRYFCVIPTRLPENKNHIFVPDRGTYDQRTILLIFQHIFFHPWSLWKTEFQIEQLSIQHATFTHYSFPTGLQQQIDRIARWVGRRAECTSFIFGIVYTDPSFPKDKIWLGTPFASPKIIHIRETEVGEETIYTISSPSNPPDSSLLNFLNLLEAYAFSPESCMNLLAYHIEGKRPFPQLTSVFNGLPEYSAVPQIAAIPIRGLLPPQA